MFRSKSVQPFERKKRTSKNTCHVPRARGTCNSRLGFFPPLNCVEWHLPGPDRTSRSGAINEFMKLRGTCLWHVSRAKCRRDTQKHSHPDGAYRPTNFEPNSSIGLACSVDDMFFSEFTRRHVALHVRVAPIGPQLARSSFGRSGTSNEPSPVPISPAVRAPGVGVHWIKYPAGLSGRIIGFRTIRYPAGYFLLSGRIAGY